MNISQKTSISTLMHQINKDQFTILVDHALLQDLELKRTALESSLKNLRLPFLKQLLGSKNQASFYACEEDALNTSFEVAFSYAMNTPQSDGLCGHAHLAYLTQIKQSAVQVDSTVHETSPPSNDPLGYAMVHLCHWRVGGGQVIMNTASPLDVEKSEAFRKKLEPLFMSEGIELLPYRNDTWIARSKHFCNLPSASFNKVMNDNVLPWLIGSPLKNAANTNHDLQASIQILRRLQSEVQMVLYDQSASTPAPGSFNSIWFSGTGDLPKGWESVGLLSPVENSEVALYDHQDSQILCLHGLTQHFQNFELDSWCAYFEELDQVIFKTFLQKPNTQIILCGSNGFKVWEPQEATLLYRVFRTLREKIFGPIDTLELLT